jgi:hypothetical protein
VVGVGHCGRTWFMQRSLPLRCSRTGCAAIRTDAASAPRVLPPDAASMGLEQSVMTVSDGDESYQVSQ